MTKGVYQFINSGVRLFEIISSDNDNYINSFRGGANPMNKTELVAAIAEKTELSKKDAEKALKAFTDVVAEELAKGEKIQLVGFGTFKVTDRKAREGRNPRTGETMTIPASKAPNS